MKILFIHDTLEIGGASLYMEWINKELKKNGYITKIINYPKKFLSLNNNNLFFNLELYQYIKKKIISFNPDIIHIHNTHKFQNSVYFACRGYKTIKTVHDYWTLYPLSGNPETRKEYILTNKILGFAGFGKSLQKYFLKKMTLISPSKELQKKLLRRNLPSNYLPCFNTLYPLKKEKRRKRNKIILYVGYLWKTKGIEILLQAFKKLPKSYELIIVGDGPQREYLKDNISNGRVTFTGWVDKEKIKKCYQDASLLIVPSLIPETGPIVIIEAMQFGLPVIGSNVPGIRETIRDNKIGVLVQPRDSKALTNSIKKLMENKKLYMAYSKNSLNAAQKYDIQTHLNNLLKIYSA